MELYQGIEAEDRGTKRGSYAEEVFGVNPRINPCLSASSYSMDIKKYPIKIIIHKHGEMIYFSQLDLTHVFERALRRSDLPVYFTQGFNPRVKLSFLNGLKLGVEGDLEMVLYFTREITADCLKEKLAGQLPQGLDITAFP